jgi:hypothetical protein
MRSIRRQQGLLRRRLLRLYLVLLLGSRLPAVLSLLDTNF